MARLFDPLYYEGYEALLRHTDEKQVFTERIAGLIHEYGAASLLDIGAGDGSLALPLSEEVATYVAVEQNPEYASRLRAAGKKVIEGLFPGDDVEGSYDLVLMSHVISHTSGNYREMVPAGWGLVKPGGSLLVATHRTGRDSDWGRLLEIVDHGENAERMAQGYDNMVAALEEIGETKVEPVVTRVETDTIDDMVTALAFRASNGETIRHANFMEHAEAVVALLDDQYRAGDRFVFPFEYRFVTTHKEL